MAQLEPEQLLSQLQALKTNPPAAIFKNGLLRTKLRLAARDVSLLLERPADAIAPVMLSQPVESIVIRIALDMDLFHILSVGRKTLDELAQATKADKVLLDSHVYFEPWLHLGPSGRANNITSYHRLMSCLQTQTSRKGLLPGPAYSALPGHLASTHYQNPMDPKNPAVQDAFNSKNKDLFAILMEKPETAQGFATLMSTWGEGNSLVQDIFPISQFLAEGESPSSATWVDVGGGYGQKTVALKAAFPELQGRFIVLHDFPDDQCITILTELRKAMQPGYSKLFIHEQIMPNRGASVRGCYFAPDGVSEGLLEVGVLE
ncbi:o-methyltransferase protein [Rutstroemia sp. NJR-2017a BBW]|nr:o-methyltransferase protein [Rutstroemia sp. NJR-2017a BBW]